MFKAENCPDSNAKLEPGRNKGVEIYHKDLINVYMSNVTKNLLLLWENIMKKRLTHKTRCTKCPEVQTASLCEGDDILKDMQFDLTFAFTRECIMHGHIP